MAGLRLARAADDVVAESIGQCVEGVVEPRLPGAPGAIRDPIAASKSDSCVAVLSASTSPLTPTPSSRTGSASASASSDCATCAITSPSSVGSGSVL